MPLILATTTPGEPEIFASVQGEGRSMGQACAFVRLSRCNLACHWCDTPYTWHFTGDNRPHRDGQFYDRAENQLALAEQDVADRIAALGQERLVVTGGEPLLQAPALARMLARLRERVPAMQVEIETNGTIAPPPVLDALIGQYNVSPKLAHSGNPAELALVPERLAEWAANARAWFKFVIAQAGDLAQVLEISDRFAIPPERIYLMAEGTDCETLSAREKWLAELCIAHRMALTKRLHIELFGDTRGT